MDVEGTTATLKNLTPSVTYELVVKAGNTNGTSVLSEPITFIVADKFIIKTNVWAGYFGNTKAGY